MAVKYVEVRELENRGAIDPAPSSEVEGLLVGTESVLEFEANHSSYGEDSVEIFPAFYEGKRAWLRRETWQAAYSYSASGTQEFILSFEDGVKLFLERGVFAFPEPSKEVVVE
jgi:hypothetical protein